MELPLQYSLLHAAPKPRIKIFSFLSNYLYLCVAKQAGPLVVTIDAGRSRQFPSFYMEHNLSNNRLRRTFRTNAVTTAKRSPSPTVECDLFLEILSNSTRADQCRNGSTGCPRPDAHLEEIVQIAQIGVRLRLRRLPALRNAGVPAPTAREL